MTTPNIPPPRACAEPGCPRLDVPYPDVYCAEHKKAGVFAKIRAEYKKWYHTTAWKKLRQVILNRDPICTCKEPGCHPNGGCHNPSTVVDHILDHGGNYRLFFDRSNLHGTCTSCHNSKTASSPSKNQ